MKIDIWRDASERLTYSVADHNGYDDLKNEIVRKFHLRFHSDRVCGLDVVFQDFAYEDSIIGIEWDNWSGFMVVAVNAEAEELVKKIGKYLEERDP